MNHRVWWFSANYFLDGLGLDFCAVLPVLELDRLELAHHHISSDVVEGKRISVTSGPLTTSVLYR